MQVTTYPQCAQIAEAWRDSRLPVGEAKTHVFARICEGTPSGSASSVIRECVLRCPLCPRVCALVQSRRFTTSRGRFEDLKV